MPVKIKSTLGSVTLAAENVSGDTTLTVPSGTGTVATTATTDALTTRVNAVGGRKNLIINGAMQVAQRGTSTTGVTTTDGYYACDRFYTQTDTGTWTISQDTSAPSGFSKSLKLDCTSAGTANADEVGVRYKFEGKDLQGLAYGTSDAKSLTFSFHIKTNKTGTYTVAFKNQNSSQDRLISANFTVDSADTWEKKTITIAGDTSYAFENTTSSEMELYFWFGVASTFTSGTQQTTSWGNYSTANMVSSSIAGLGGSTADYVNITGVQLELGDTATDFEHRSYGEELALCQRYFQKSYNDGTAPGTATNYGQVRWFTSQQWGVTSVPVGPVNQGYVTLPVEMRAVPTIVAYSPSTGTKNRFKLGSSGSDVTPNQWLHQANSTTYIGYPQNAGGASFGNADNIDFHWTADAEL